MVGWLTTLLARALTHAQSPSPFGVVAATFILLAGLGCQQKMARQPSYRPLEPSDFFADGRSSRPPVPGTVARWPVREGDAGWFPTASDQGPRPGGSDGSVSASTALLSFAGPWDLLGELAASTAATAQTTQYTEVFPAPVTEQVLRRGRQRYQIFCAPCHDDVGSGNGKIVERGYLKPPNYHTDLSRGYDRRGIRMPLRDAPVGYYYEVISRGMGGMPDYAAQIPPADRWAIIAYIRALQFSQQAPLNDLPAQDRERASQSEEAKP